MYKESSFEIGAIDSIAVDILLSIGNTTWNWQVVKCIT